jgi:hypothetical protein
MRRWTNFHLLILVSVLLYDLNPIDAPPMPGFPHRVLDGEIEFIVPIGIEDIKVL